MELIARAPWREAVTYRDTWPHEYMLIKKDRQRELLAAFCARIADGERVEGRFFSKSFTYLFLGDHEYWTYTPCARLDMGAKEDDFVLNRARIDRNPRDFEVRSGAGSERWLNQDATILSGGARPTSWKYGRCESDPPHPSFCRLSRKSS